MQAASPGLFANRPFVALFGAALISLAGDQLTLLGLPWLALAMGGDARVVGTVLALVAVPRAVLLLAGGALADRFRPARMLIVSRLACAATLLLLGAAVWSQRLDLPQLYALALLLGIGSALGMPCGQALLAQVLPAERLKVGTALTMGIAQLVAVAGPVLAGLLLARLGSGGFDTLAYVFWTDAATFLLSALMLWRLRAIATTGAATGSLLRVIRDGLAFVRDDAPLRAYVSYVAAVSFFVTGPVAVAIPLLARAQGGATQYGAFMSTLGVGALVGMALAPALRIAAARLMYVVVALDCVVGALLIAFVNLHAGPALYAVLLGVGAIGGFVQATVLPLVQLRVPQPYMARTMSLLMFAYVGLVPLSSALTGWLIERLSLPGTLELMGVGVILTALAFLFDRRLAQLPVAAAKG